jgi:hypothetical protein
VLDRAFDFDETLDAMAYVEQGKANRKIRRHPLMTAAASLTIDGIAIGRDARYIRPPT